VAGERFTTTLEIRWADSDRLGHVNNTKFVEYAQEARIAFMRELVPGGHGRKSATVVRRMEVDFLRPLKDSSGPLRVEMTVTSIGTTSFGIDHEMYDVDGELAARVHALLVGFDIATDAKRVLDDGFRSNLQKYLATDSAA
jgi:acyl-CoA thioester hydrolase